MSDLEIEFYDDDKRIPVNLGDTCDDGTTTITIPTPDGWKCERKGCTADYLHEHTTYAVLTAQSNAGAPAQN